MQQRHQEALEHFEKALTLQPAAFSVHNNMGNSLRAAGDLSGAESSYRTALRIHPDYVHACCNLGALLAETGCNAEAETWLLKATRLQADFTDAWNHLGNLHLARNEHPTAEAYYRKALVINPRFVASICNLADLLLVDRRMDEAEALYREGITHMPDDPDIRGGLARLLERKGSLDEARKLVSTTGSHDEQNIRILLARSVLSDQAGEPDDIIQSLEAVLDQPISDRQRMDLHFELGRHYDRIAAYGKAFQHYRAGNELDRSEFDEMATIAEFDRLKKVFSRDRLDSWPRSGIDSNLPVFIVGMPRSGTSLVEQIIASHPRVSGAGELDAMDNLAGSLPERLGVPQPYPECLEHQISIPVLRSAAEIYIGDLRKFSPTAARVTDKMPHNFRHLGLIELLFPQARIIHCRRDPRDTCLSIYFNQFNINHPYAHDLGQLARYYALYDALMRHWSDVLSVPIMTVDYGTLVLKQEAVTREIIGFLGLPWSEACLQFHATRRIVDTPSYQQVRKPMHDGSLGRWKHYREFIGDYFDMADCG